MFGSCTETVSILYAVVFGAGDACVSLSTGSLLTALGAFFVLVLCAQFLARRLWAKLTKRHAQVDDDFIPSAEDHPYLDDPNYRNSAIRSSKR